MWRAYYRQRRDIPSKTLLVSYTIPLSLPIVEKLRGRLQYAAHAGFCPVAEMKEARLANWMVHSRPRRGSILERHDLLPLPRPTGSIVVLHPDVQMSDAEAGVRQLRSHRQWVPLDAALLLMCRDVAPTRFCSCTAASHVWASAPTILARLVRGERRLTTREWTGRQLTGRASWDMLQVAQRATQPWLWQAVDGPEAFCQGLMAYTTPVTSDLVCSRINVLCGSRSHAYPNQRGVRGRGVRWLPLSSGTSSRWLSG